LEFLVRGGMEINPYVLLLIGILLIYDIVGPSVFSALSGSKDRNDTAEDVNPAHNKSENDVLQDLLQKSAGGRVYVAYCTS